MDNVLTLDPTDNQIFYSYVQPYNRTEVDKRLVNT